MPNDIHFFISSLPLLKKGQKTPLSYSQFTAECKRNLSERDARKLCQVTLDPQDGPRPDCLETLRRWLDFETFLRNATAEARAARRHLPAPARKPAEMISQFTLKIVSDAFAKGNPAERESLLDDARWSRLEELQAPHQFDLDFLAVYALKIMLLERMQSRQFEPGLKTFERLVDGAVRQAAENRVQD